MAALLFLRGIPTRIYEASETRGSPAKHWGGKDCLNGIEFKDSKIFVKMSAGKANKGRSSGAGRTSSGGSSKASSKDASKTSNSRGSNSGGKHQKRSQSKFAGLCVYVYFPMGLTCRALSEAATSTANSTEVRAAEALTNINDSGVTTRAPRRPVPPVNPRGSGNLPLGLAPSQGNESEDDGLPEEEEEEEEEEVGMDTAANGDGDDGEEGELEGTMREGQSSPPEEVDALSEGETASTMTGQFYSESFARRLLKTNAVSYEEMLSRFVVHEVFKDMKFTQGDDDEEMGLVQLSIDEKYVVIDDPRISHSAFVAEFFPCISKFVTGLRTRSHNNARKKFIRK